MSRKALIIVTAILILINIYMVIYHSIYAVRIFRVVSSFIYFIIFLYVNGKNKFILTLLGIIAISDIFNIYYEIPLCSKLTSIFKINSYLLMCYHIAKKLALVKFKRSFLIIFIIVTLLNLALLFKLVLNLPTKGNDPIELILLLIYGTVLIGVTGIAVNYNFRYATSRSTWFFYFVFSYVIADVTGFFAMFLGYSWFLYVARLFYILALFCTIWYVFYTKEEEDVLVVEN